MDNAQLSDEEREVLFGGSTEAPFSGALLHETRDGSFTCKNCGQELFASNAKFDSGSGWPSFTEPANRKHLAFKKDTSFGMERTEVSCANCGAHLGHVFDDYSQEAGGQYYCINSVCLNFTPKQTDTEDTA
jgi:peptide-methionine (R)-S-oxide reductase